MNLMIKIIVLFTITEENIHIWKYFLWIVTLTLKSLHFLFEILKIISRLNFSFNLLFVKSQKQIIPLLLWSILCSTTSILCKSVKLKCHIRKCVLNFYLCTTQRTTLWYFPSNSSSELIKNLSHASPI